MRKRVLLALLPALALAVPVTPASAHLQTGPALAVGVWNAIGVHKLPRVERAITTQINDQVGPLWRTPRIYFAKTGSAGIVVLLEGAESVAQQCEAPLHSVDGCHWFRNGVVYLSVARVGWSRTLSHELIEGLVDPNGDLYSNGILLEPCDPVNSQLYLIHGVWVSDFVLPAWFGNGSGPRYDWLRIVHKPGALNGGYEPY